ncbi:MAG: aryl-sulfate sulfotransferase [Actinomycetota bacterium]
MRQAVAAMVGALLCLAACSSDVGESIVDADASDKASATGEAAPTATEPPGAETPIPEPATPQPPTPQPANPESSATPQPTAAPLPTATSVPAAEGSGDLTIVAAPFSPLAGIATVEAAESVAVRLEAESEDHVVRTPWTSAEATIHELPLVGLRAERTYDVRAFARGADGPELLGVARFVSGALPAELPTFDVQGTTDDLTLLEVVPFDRLLAGESNLLAVLDQEGEVVWFHQDETSLAAVSRTPAGGILAISPRAGVEEFGIDGRRIRSWATPEVGTDFNVDEATVIFADDAVDLVGAHHDVQLLPDGTLLFLSETFHEVSQAQRDEIGCLDDGVAWGVVSDVVVHLDADGTVLRTWDLWDVLSFGPGRGDWLCRVRGPIATETERDWTHANSVVFDAERNAVIVSVRHTDQIVALDMGENFGSQTGVRWILGADGTIPYDGESFHHTHAVTVAPNGDLVFYDNGNFRPGDRGRPYSRAVRIRVDDAAADRSTWSATQVWDHVLEDPVTGAAAYASLVSDADLLPDGNVLVTHGGLTRPFFHAHLVEIIPSSDAEDGVGGEIVWEVRLGDEDGPVAVYRADRWDSLYFGDLWEPAG